MKYEDYFSMFLSIEEELAEFLKVINYSEKHQNIYSHKLVLMLLQTCPIIESYLVRLSTSSESVKKSSAWDSDIKDKIWETKKDKSIKLSSGNRQISGFPKFACIAEEVFELSKKEVTFYHSVLFQSNGGCTTSTYTPFSELGDTLPSFHSEYKNNKTKYPKLYRTPQWWTAYNKIKHSFDGVAQDKVNYAVVIEALAALFCILCFCEPGKESLKGNGYLAAGMIKSRLFEIKL
ncbi:hypothetical protein [Paraglaciecola hydrolytica]|uniref:Uncharacterized protein n=1 Tax=Paraglaciecola hydrolytica TaxID=1799789 RepID=A0A148KK75_9ALTE|nr:hypothetical protein [Paraglaciecola hydrolytica]KXI26703.1 hypothetical protein AX660_02700 [Paraglaciecola hydrolytica]